METVSLAEAIALFLEDLRRAERSAHTVRAYATELRHLSACHTGPVATIVVDTVRAALARRDGRSPASRARTAAALNSFLTWAVRHDLLAANPLLKLDRVQVPDPDPRGVPRSTIDAILAAIPRDQLRDQLLFRLLAETELRISEALQLEVDDLDLTPDNEHLHVLGKRGQRRTMLLDDPQLVRLLRRYLKVTKAQHGPLCSGHSRTGMAGRCATRRCRSAGRPTAPPLVSSARYTSCVTATRRRSFRTG